MHLSMHNIAILQYINIHFEVRNKFGSVLKKDIFLTEWNTEVNKVHACQGLLRTLH